MRKTEGSEVARLALLDEEDDLIVLRSYPFGNSLQITYERRPGVNVESGLGPECFARAPSAGSENQNKDPYRQWRYDLNS